MNELKWVLRKYIVGVPFSKTWLCIHTTIINTKLLHDPISLKHKHFLYLRFYMSSKHHIRCPG